MTMATTHTSDAEKSPSKAILWTGRVISGICVLFLLVDAVMKIARAQPSVEGTVTLGFSDALVQPLGLLILLFTILYSLPRSAFFGALFLTAHLGGATATMILAANGGLAFLFPVIFCVLLWTGLVFRDSSLRLILTERK